MNLLDQRPDSPEWRADALARSGHSRLTSEGFLPTCHPDQLPPDQADPCAEICRALLGDFAPALLLLDAASRRRVQALAALARALDDCAVEHGTEGQRLAALNRWEFALEAALDGAPSEHPVLVAMARADALQPWPRAALAALFADARRRATHSEDPRAVAARAAALTEALFGAPPMPSLAALAMAILNGPKPAVFDSPRSQADHHQAPRASSAGTLADDSAIREVPTRWRAALRYALLAARARLASTPASGRVRSLSAGTRLVLLARARWGARAR